MNNTVEVSIKEVYGNELVYPVNMTAKQLCSLTGKKTLAMHDLATILELGYTVKEVNTSNKLSVMLGGK